MIRRDMIWPSTCFDHSEKWRFNEVRLLEIPPGSLPYNIFIHCGISVPSSPVFCEICNSWTWQNTAETPHSQNCASQGCSWIGGHQLYPARGDALRQSGSSVTKKIMVDQCWSSFSSLIYIYILILPFEDLRVPFLDKPRCWSSSVSVIGLGHSCTGRCGNPAPAAWALSRRFPYKISDGLAWIIECLEVHDSCNDSTAFCSTFLWNCLYSAF